MGFFFLFKKKSYQSRVIWSKWLHYILSSLFQFSFVLQQYICSPLTMLSWGSLFLPISVVSRVFLFFNFNTTARFFLMFCCYTFLAPCWNGWKSMKFYPATFILDLLLSLLLLLLPKAVDRRALIKPDAHFQHVLFLLKQMKLFLHLSRFMFRCVV